MEIRLTARWCLGLPCPLGNLLMPTPSSGQSETKHQHSKRACVRACVRVCVRACVRSFNVEVSHMHIGESLALTTSNFILVPYKRVARIVIYTYSEILSLYK